MDNTSEIVTDAIETVSSKNNLARNIVIGSAATLLVVGAVYVYKRLRWTPPTEAEMMNIVVEMNKRQDAQMAAANKK